MIDRIDINKYKLMLSDYLQINHNININKPFTCLNPKHDDKHPSMSYTEKYNICKCFSCGVKYDIFDLIGIDYNVDSFKEKLEIADRLYPDISKLELKKINFIKEDNQLIDFTYYFIKCKNNIDKTDYLLKRKIDPCLLEKYRIGYDKNKEMIIFPINKNCYFARGINENKKIKSKGISYLWNENLLKNNENDLIYVTESVIDSLSLETIDSNVKTIALNGLPNYKRLLKVVEENNYNGNLVLAFDNDKMGLSYQEIVKEELAKLNVSSFCTTIISSFADESCKDLNEALINNKEKLIKNYDFFNENFKLIIDKRKNKGSEIEL